MPDATGISEAEWQVMNVVWNGQPVDSQHVIDQLAANNWSSATIKTMLHRLVKKKVLAFEQTGKRYLYRAAVGRGCVVQEGTVEHVQDAGVPQGASIIRGAVLHGDALQGERPV